MKVHGQGWTHLYIYQEEEKREDGERVEEIRMCRPSGDVESVNDDVLDGRS